MSMFNAEQRDYLRDCAQAKRNDNAPGPRRAEAFAAFLKLVEDYGTAKIDCDMESYGREPGDIVTILVAAPLGGYYSSHEMAFTPENVQRFAAKIEPLYEADAALLTGEDAPRQQEVG